MIVSLEQGAARIRRGELVAFPTETIYGIGADPFNGEAIAKLADYKSRGVAHGITLIVESGEWVDRFTAAEEPEVRERRLLLQRTFWPGPLTVVFTVHVDAEYMFPEQLFGPARSLAVRVSPHPVAHRLAVLSGGAITSTSANHHGLPPATTPLECEAYFPEMPVVSGGESDAPSLPSTIVDARSLPFAILRRGSVSEAALAEFVMAKSANG